MNEDELKQFIKKTIDQKMNSMDNLAVPNHFHNGWDANQLDPAISLLGFPVIQVTDATVAPTDVPSNGTFRFYVDLVPVVRLWAYTVRNNNNVLTGTWKYLTLT